MKLHGEKTCTKCKVTKPLLHFAGRKASPDGLQYWCRECGCGKRKARSRLPRFTWRSTLAEHGIDP